MLRARQLLLTAAPRRFLRQRPQISRNVVPEAEVVNEPAADTSESKPQLRPRRYFGQRIVQPPEEDKKSSRGKELQDEEIKKIEKWIQLESMKKKKGANVAELSALQRELEPPEMKRRSPKDKRPSPAQIEEDDDNDAPDEDDILNSTRTVTSTRRGRRLPFPMVKGKYDQYDQADIERAEKQTSKATKKDLKSMMAELEAELQTKGMGMDQFMGKSTRRSVKSAELDDEDKSLEQPTARKRLSQHKFTPPPSKQEMEFEKLFQKRSRPLKDPQMSRTAKEVNKQSRNRLLDELATKKTRKGQVYIEDPDESSKTKRTTDSRRKTTTAKTSRDGGSLSDRIVMPTSLNKSAIIRNMETSEPVEKPAPKPKKPKKEPKPKTDNKNKYDDDLSNRILSVSAAADFGDFRVGWDELPEDLLTSINLLLKGQSPKVLRSDFDRIARAMYTWTPLLKTAEEKEDEKHKEAEVVSDKTKNKKKKRTKDGSDSDDDESLDNFHMPQSLQAKLAQMTKEKLAELSDDDRKTGNRKNIAPDGITENPSNAIQYGDREALAYVAGRLPAVFGADRRVLQEVYYRLRKFYPKSMLDFGTGPGTAIWAAHHVFDQNIPKILGVDTSESMLRVAEKLLTDEDNNQVINGVSFQRYLNATASQQYDLVVASYSLGELPTARLRASTIETLWSHTKEVLVIIEPGSPEGFKNILLARDMFVVSGQDSTRELFDGSLPLTHKEEHHIVAPCPHEKACPMNKESWCYFVQRAERKEFTRSAKNASNNYEDEKFCYLVVRRGKRPDLLLANKAIPETETETKPAETEPAQTKPSGEISKDELEMLSYSWPRVLRQPMRRKGHVIMDFCTPDGAMERKNIAKSHGKQIYRDARKSFLGNLWPHHQQPSTTPQKE